MYKKLRTRIAHALYKYPELRNNDRELMAYLWGKDIRADRTLTDYAVYTPEEIEIIEKFLRKFSVGKYSHGPTVKRIRARLQEKNKELRGEAYWKRHNIDVVQIQAELYGQNFNIESIKF